MVSISSFTVLADSAGLTTSTLGDALGIVIAVKPPTGS